MSNGARDSEEDSQRLVRAINDFLRDQLNSRTDWSAEDRDCLEIAVQCLEMAFGLESGGFAQHGYSRPLMDVFNQVTNPVSVKNKLRADAHKDEGNNYMRRGLYSEAENEYTQAIELDKWNAIYYCNRASSRIEQQHFFDAISDCRQALMLNPDYAKAHARMGQAYALLHRPREAARCFREALQLEPGNERYRNNLRVAESQIESRHDPMNLITSLLSSVFGMRPTTSNNNSSRTSFPTSFMIITESHPPAPRNAPAESSQTSDRNATTTVNINDQTPNIVYPLPFGVINPGSAEETIPEVDISRDNRNIDDSELSGELIIEIPRLSFLDTLPSPRCPSDSCVDTRVNREMSNEQQANERASTDDSDKNEVKNMDESQPSKEANETENSAQYNLQRAESKTCKMNENGKNMSEKQISSGEESSCAKKITSKENISNSPIQDKSATDHAIKTPLASDSDNFNMADNGQASNDSETVRNISTEVQENSKVSIEKEDGKNDNGNKIETSSTKEKQQDETKNNDEQDKNVTKEDKSGLNANKNISSIVSNAQYNKDAGLKKEEPTENLD